MLDIVFKNGTLIDGTGKEPFRADLGIKNGKIKTIGCLDRVSDSCHVVDVSGKVVTPGFIDAHSHSELRLLSKPIPEAKVKQGITTEILGQDGLSVAPVKSQDVGLYRQLLAGLLGNPDVDWNWSSVGEFLERLENHGLPINVGYLVPHGMLRIMVIGMDDRPASEKEIGAMKDLLDDALTEGAIGLSTGMIYPPCSYASDQELVELTSVLPKHRGKFVIHMHDEGEWLLESAKRTIDICRQSGAALHISHLKAYGKRNWHKAPHLVDMIVDARKEGIPVTADQYPYVAGSTLLTACLPQWTLAGGTQACLKRLAKERDKIKEWFKKDVTIWANRSISIGWENIVVSSVKTDANRWVEGLSLESIAERRKSDPVDALCDLLLEEELAATQIAFYGNEESIVTYMKCPFAMICTDGIYGGKPHPRLFGSFPRVLGRYVKDKRVLTLEEAICKMTSLPASTFGFRDRGIIAPGYAADLVVFDPDTVMDKATFEQPEQDPVGISYVLVNGRFVIENGLFTGEIPGSIVTLS